jgi:hypothetical protein
MYLEWEEIYGKLGIAGPWSWVSSMEYFECEAGSLTVILKYLVTVS